VNGLLFVGQLMLYMRQWHMLGSTNKYCMHSK